jgi:hypothetical protein
VVYSDPVNLTVPQMADLATTCICLAALTRRRCSQRTMALQTNYISETGNHVGKVTLSNASKIQNWFAVAG